MITKKMKALVLSAMIFTSVGIISVSKNGATSTEFKGGAAAALAGAYTGDAVWAAAGGIMMEMSASIAAVPGFQVAAAVGFL